VPPPVAPRLASLAAPVAAVLVALAADVARAEPPAAPSSAPEAVVPAPGPASSGAPPSAEQPPRATAAGAPKHEVEIVFDPAEPNLVVERAPAKRDGWKVDSEGWTAVCVPGCRTRLDRAARYQIAGTWVNPAPLVLPPGDGPFRVTATPGSARSDLVGTGFLLAGGVTFAVGGAGLVALLSSGATKNQEAGSAASGLLVASITTAAVGLALVLVSLPLRAGNATRVRVERAPEPPPPRPAPPAPSPAAPSVEPGTARDPRMF
jgi:hypothetical protein